jgi:hypothetical protein
MRIRIGTILLMASLALASCGMFGDFPEAPPATGVTIDKTSLLLAAGTDVRLDERPIPGDAYYDTCVWSSSNPAVATVDNYGMVHGVSDGSAVITVTIGCDGAEYSAQCAVTVVTVRAQGEVSSPMPLVMNSDFLFKLETSAAAYGYYVFSIPTAGAYALDLRSSTPYQYALFSDAGFSVPAVDSDGMGVSGVTERGFLANLATPGTYYLRLRSDKVSTVVLAYGTICDSGYFSTRLVSTGLATEPVSLTLGTAFSARIGVTSYDSACYFTFDTADSSDDYLVTVNDLSPYGRYYLYSDANLSEVVQSGVVGGDCSIPFLLARGARYYLKITEDAYVEKPSVFTLLVGPSPVPAIVELLPDGTWKKRQVDSDAVSVWYRVPARSGVGYQVYLDNAHEGSDQMDSSCSISAYRADRLTPYFLNVDKAYSSPKSLVVSPGETEFYLRVLQDEPSSEGSFAVRVVTDTSSLGLTIQ